MRWNSSLVCVDGREEGVSEWMGRERGGGRALSRDKGREGKMCATRPSRPAAKWSAAVEESLRAHVTPGAPVLLLLVHARLPSFGQAQPRPRAAASSGVHASRRYTASMSIAFSTDASPTCSSLG